MGKILVIEDQPLNRQLMQVILEKSGHAVLMAEDAAAGLDLARREQPGLIFMDIQLPGMDGLEATRLLKQDAATRDITVVAVTSYAMKGDRERILAAGCDGYLAKPVSTTRKCWNRWRPCSGRRNEPGLRPARLNGRMLLWKWEGDGFVGGASAPTTAAVGAKAPPTKALPQKPSHSPPRKPIPRPRNSREMQP